MSENCVITNKAPRDAEPDADPAVVAFNNPTNATFKIADAKLYVPVVNLSTENGNKLLEQFKKDLKEPLNGTNANQKCLIRLKLTI